jgi:hypothetical protein
LIEELRLKFDDGDVYDIEFFVVKSGVDVFPDDSHECTGLHDVFGLDAFETVLVIGQYEHILLFVFNIVNGRAGIKWSSHDNGTVKLTRSGIETDWRETDVDTIGEELLE